MTRLRHVENFPRRENLKDAIHPGALHGIFWHDCIKIEGLYANLMGCSDITWAL